MRGDSMFSHTGNSTVIIKKQSNKEIVARLENVDYTIFFDTQDKVAKSIKNHASLQTYSPDRIEFNGQSVSTELTKFLFKKPFQEEILIPVKETEIVGEDGVLYLRQIPDSNDIQVYESETILAAFDVDLEQGKISSLPAEKLVEVNYYVSKNSHLSFDISGIQSEYYELTILNTGNKNGYNKNMMLEIPKAVVRVEEQLQFEKSNIAALSMTFIIIDNKIIVHYY